MRSAPGRLRRPLFAALATVIVIVLGFFGLWPLLYRPPSHQRVPDWTDRDMLIRHRTAGDRALGEGSFALALEEYGAAVKLYKRQPSSLSEGEGRDLYHDYRQSDLLANELRPSLADLLKEAENAPNDAEWVARFKKDYLGKSVIFDDEIRSDGEGRRALRQMREIRWNQATARVSLAGLKLVEHLPPQRWIFGARLESFRREGAGWVIAFNPDSGTLLTEEAAVCSWRPELQKDPALSELLARQKTQLSQILIPEP